MLELLKHGKIGNIGNVGNFRCILSNDTQSHLYSNNLCAFTRNHTFYIINIFKLSITG